MNYDILLFLPAVLVLGFLTSYTDIKNGKIKNNHLLVALLYGLIVYAFLMFFFAFNGMDVNQEYLIEIVSNSLISLIIGFFMWLGGLWTAGDSKLFFTYSFLVPISLYQYSYVAFFPSIVLMANTFVPVFIAMFFIIIAKTNLSQKIHALKKSFSLKAIANLALSLFALWWVVNLSLSFLGRYNSIFRLLGNNYAFMLIIMFTILLAVDITKGKFYFLLLGIAAFRFSFDYSIYSIQFLSNFLLIIGILIFLRFFLLELVFLGYTKHVDIVLLEKGMIPAEIVYLEKGKYKKMQISDILSYYLIKKGKKTVFNYSSDGLTEKDVILLKKLEKQKKLDFEHIIIYNQIPFAPFLFLGAIITFIFKGNVFAFISNFI
jgi:archaeal preflagellin peptidase FlaK